ncbi:PREDICTED: ubiquitin carboxyl-terminal hydrolase 17-like [Nelumbo nucifera]|uniref:Ubiquitin carboxyl-terminal hydrolase 17-like n=1 Tax=Nelumbo nucifera TaxID=4432 RepID=A0A1U8BK72_NELNU|nr:PREDICTED: ubiquitin carboxyl-terminal hydrolase 17-like [Nelumbo nucifera]
MDVTFDELSSFYDYSQERHCPKGENLSQLFALPLPILVESSVETFPPSTESREDQSFHSYSSVPIPLPLPPRPLFNPRLYQRQRTRSEQIVSFTPHEPPTLPVTEETTGTDTAPLESSFPDLDILIAIRRGKRKSVLEALTIPEWRDAMKTEIYALHKNDTWEVVDLPEEKDPIGYNCYANAVLQCLAFTRPLACYLLQGHHSKACPKKEWCFTCEFEALILRAREGKSPLSPIGILSQIQNIGSHLGHGREEDAHEFLRYAIDAMQSICLREAGSNVDVPYAEETTLIGLIFGGYLRSKIRCLKCQGKSERIERMLDLTVEIEGDIGTLEEALAKFTTAEILDGENKYQCERCKSYEKAKKKLTVLEAPNVLTIALKRFQTGKFGKLNKLVRFPEVLNLTPYMNATSDKSPVYTLYAVVVHLDIMNAAFSGHYICYIKNFQGKWFKIDDSMVKPVEPEKVLSKGAYMLFYARCSPRAPSLVRNSLIHDDKVKRSRCSEAVPSSHSGNNMSNERPSVVPSASPKDLPFWTTTDGTINYGSFDSDNRSFRRHQIPKVDWFSDSSSLFSCSDEGSCSTESTRDSTSTEDLHDYIFGEAICGWKSPLRVSSDSDGASSPLGSSFSPQSMSKSHSLNSPDTSGYQTYSTKPETGKASTKLRDKSGIGEDLQGKERPPLLYSDTTKSCRKFTTHRSSSSGSSNSNSLGSCSCRETDRKRLGVVNPFGWRSGVTMRRGTRERAAQTFY